VRGWGRWKRVFIERLTSLAIVLWLCCGIGGISVFGGRKGKSLRFDGKKWWLCGVQKSGAQENPGKSSVI
jgi:hypothetical protein